MPPQNEEDLDVDDVVFSDGQALSPEIAAIRAREGTLGDVTSEAGLLRKGAAAATEERLGVTGQIQAGVEGAASGLTFGMSRALNAGDPLAAAAELERQRTFAGTALVGELGGALLGAGFSGGTGLGGSIARLTPAGLSAAKSAQFIARGGTGLARFGRGLIAGAGEGAIQAAGNYVGQSVLRGDALSAESAALAALKGGAFGAAAGGVVEGGAGIFKALTRSGSATDGIGRKLAGLDDVDGPPLRMDEVMTGKADDVAEAHATLRQKIDDVRARDLGGEVDDLLTSPILKNTAASADGTVIKKIEGTLKRQAAELDRARTAAADWATRYGKAMDDVKAGDLPDKMLGVVKDLDDEGAIHLARLDEAVDAYEGQISKVRERYIQAPATTPTIAPVDAVSLPGAPEALPQGAFAKLRTAAETVAGGLETAQDLGLPVPTLSQLAGGGAIGQMLGLYVRAKAGARALKAAGVLPRTSTTEAAAGVTGLRRSIATALETRGLPVVSTVARLAPKAISKAAQQVVDSADGQDDAMHAASTLDFDANLAGRASERVNKATAYLAKTAPKNPFAGTPFADAWDVSPYEAMDWQRRVSVVFDPARAVATMMRDPTAAIEAEALFEVYPDIATEVREYLAVNSARLLTELSEPQRQFLGYTFGVPLTLTQVPGYTFSMPPMDAPAPQGKMTLARPSNANASPLAKVEQV